ncbi:MAG: hypothetical protein D6785_02825 [Planctomycetota bacterium]|nr:MAG: hypothetical protein D6785_02825 [Planctomycetota bacterium]
MNQTQKRSFEDWVEKLYHLPRYGKSLTLDRMSLLLEKLGNPQKKFPAILIGGTNGKGSVASFCHSILYHSEYHAGLFTSPHFYDVRERFKIGNRLISKQEFCSIMEILWPAVKELQKEDMCPSGFEAFTAIAFLAFARAHIQIAVLEVGLGGRFDPTSLAKKIAAVITNIGEDHIPLLGETKEELLLEKLGITEGGIPLFSGEKDELLKKIIMDVGEKKGFPVYFWGDDFSGDILVTSLKGQCLRITTPFYDYDHLFCPLLGYYQVENLATALSLIDYLRRFKGYLFSLTCIEKGIKRTDWPGRIEILSTEPLVIVDAAHNPPGMERMVESVKDIIQGKKTLIVAGFSADKPYGQMLDSLHHLQGDFIFTQASYRGAPIENLKEVALKKGFQGCWTSSLEEAFQVVKAKIPDYQALLICGGLFLAAEARQKIFQVFS